ncbi:dynamin family protein [Nocardia thailandica]|uniref:dynamin family protein n=1 Tax=Nocardia thailandica TaxID=257275 RepID=UPI0005B86928|nr:dynamin family protein [Nocardia thailandica]
MEIAVQNTTAPAATPLSVLEETIVAARAAGRADLVARLDAVADGIRDPRRRIVVTGWTAQGKSRFVNALLNLDISPVGDGLTTTVPIQLAHGAQPKAEAVLAGPGAPPSRVEFPVEELPVIDTGSVSADGRQIVRFDVEVPNPLLADGIVLIDTPGLGGRGTSGAATVLGMLPSADAVLVVSDASTELTEPELAFLRQARELCPAVAVVTTKTDLYPHWRQVGSANEHHLRTAGLDVALIPVSSVLRSHAMLLQDAELGRESGFGDIYQFLREQVVSRDQDHTRLQVARELSSAAEHLALAIGSELMALRDPERAAAAVTELQHARATAEDLHRHTASWQQTLSDGITDLAGDIDHDLRERLRNIARTGEEWIDSHDPGRHWEAITEWLTGTVDTALGDSLLWTRSRAEHLADQVAAHFHEANALDIPDGIAALEQGPSVAATLGDLEPDIGFGSKVLVGMRGSYGGILMVGLATTFAGLAMLNPVSLGAGVLLGGKAYRDDKQQRLVRRRAEAKAAVRRFLDDVAFQSGKDSKDRLHRIHRALRDHYAGIADRTLRSIDESLRAAQEAAHVATAQRTERTALLERRLAAVADLRRYAETLQPTALAG